MPVVASLALAADEEHELPTGFLGLEGLLLVAGIAAVPVPWRDVSS